MIRTILVPVSGSRTDEAVFATAFAAARPLAAHLDFYHVRLSAGDAALHAAHVDFCVGDALPAAMGRLRESTQHLSAAAADHVRSFCGRHAIEMRDAPGPADEIGASYVEETDEPRERLLMRARADDLIVLGRRSHLDHLPSLVMEDLLLHGGRPVLVAPDHLPESLVGRIAVGWTDTPESVRALAAAMPLLEKAADVVILHVARKGQSCAGLDALVRQLAWHGIAPSSEVVAGTSRDVAADLAGAAAARGAELLVVGAFGHGRLRELTFGGVTQSLLRHAALPVLMMH